jgi:hypothetical protein
VVVALLDSGFSTTLIARATVCSRCTARTVHLGVAAHYDKELTCGCAAGKTTVAGMYGRILRDLGMLSKGDVVVKIPADFVGDVLGESEKKTAAILEAARGSVLVIDEAYGLFSEKSNDPFRVSASSCIVPSRSCLGSPGSHQYSSSGIGKRSLSYIQLSIKRRVMDSTTVYY